MNDIFISYAREDKEFVERLHEALKSEGRPTWIDWEGIAPSAEWFQELLRAIERADAIVIVLTPHSAASKICSDEISHAVKHNKRLIPILRAEVDDILLPQPIRERQWIFLRDADDFRAGVSAAIVAIDTDLEWVRSHTRLLSRALEWDGYKRDYSFTLRGKDLKNAESVLRTQEKKEPQLIPLQIDYILTSRRAVTRRFSIAMGGAALALVAIIVFGLLFWQKRQENALTLASNFRDKGLFELFGTNPSAAEVLFARALTIDDNGITRARLIEARARSPRLTWVSPGGPALAVVSLSRDGKFYALRAGSDIETWSINTRSLFQSWSSPDEAKIGTFSSDNHFFAVSHGTRIEVWDVASGARTHHIEIPYEITSLRFGYRDQDLIVGCVNGNILVWNTTTASQSPRYEFIGHADRVTSTVITADGKTLISGSWDDTVKIWDMVEGRELRTLAGHEDSILCVALNPAEDIIASAGWDATIVVWDLKTGKRLTSMEGHRGSIVALSFSADGLRLASTSEDRTTRVWDIEKGRYSLTLPGYGADPTAISFVESTTSRLVAIGDANGTVRIWDLGAIGQRDELTTLRGHTGSVTMFAFNPQRAMLVSASVDNTVRLWDLDKQQIVQLLPKLPDKVASVKFSLDGELFAFATYRPVVQVWNVATNSSRDFQAPRGEERIRYVAFSPDGALLAAGSDDGRITLWSVKDAKVIISFIAHSAKIQGLEFNPLGTLLASSSDDAKVKLWRTSDWVLMHEFSGHRTGTYGIAFSPDGQALVSTSDDKTVRLWAVESGKELIKPLTHDGPVWSADFSPDGKLIATGGEDSTVQLWNMSIDRTAAKLDHHQVLRISDGPIWWIKFAQTSKGLIIGVGGQDRTIRLLNLTKLGQMFGKPDRLEYEAEQQSGLQASQKDNVIDLVPISPDRFAISGIGN